MTENLSDFEKMYGINDIVDRTLQMEELSGMEKLFRHIELQASSQSMRDDIMYTDTIESSYAGAWIEQISPWEKQYDREEVRRVRSQFLERVARLLLEPSVIKSYFQQWEKAQFTSSRDGYVCIGNAWAQFSKAPVADKNELDSSEPSAAYGRSDVTMLASQSMVWGSQNTKNTMIAVRGKIPGVRYVKEGNVLRGDVDIDVPGDFPVLLAERLGDVFYILYPLACPGFLYKEMVFERHPFYGPADFRPEPWHEGIMILMGDGTEMRSKYSPTVDVLLAGNEVWECTYTSGQRKLRPRFGKWAKSPTLIYSMVTPTVLFAKNQAGSVTISEVTGGSCSGSRYCRGKEYVLDSGLRYSPDKGYPVPIANFSPLPSIRTETVSKNDDGELLITKHNAKEVMRYRASLHKGVVPDKQILGSKAILIDVTAGVYIMVQERGKPWDLPGGKLEARETSMDALVRELREETGQDYGPSEFVSLGTSDIREGDNYYCSYLFAAMLKRPISGCIVRECPLSELFFVRSDSQPWMIRINDFLSKTFNKEMIVDLVLERRGLSDSLPVTILTHVRTAGRINGKTAKRIIMTYRPHITNSGFDIFMHAIGLKRSGPNSGSWVYCGKSDYSLFGVGKVSDPATTFSDVDYW